MTTRQRSKTAAGSRRSSEPSATHGDRGVAERERHVDDASLAALREGQSAAPKYIQHCLIFTKHVCFEPRKAGLSAKTREMPNQKACNAAAAVTARGEESKLGALRVVAVLRG